MTSRSNTDAATAKSAIKSASSAQSAQSQGLFPYSTLTIARSSYTPDVIVEGIEGDIVLVNNIEEMLQRKKEVTDTYCKALGIVTP